MYKKLKILKFPESRQRPNGARRNHLARVKIDSGLWYLIKQAILNLNNGGYASADLPSFCRQAFRTYANKCVANQIGLVWKPLKEKQPYSKIELKHWIRVLIEKELFDLIEKGIAALNYGGSQNTTKTVFYRQALLSHCNKTIEEQMGIAFKPIP